MEDLDALIKESDGKDFSAMMTEIFSKLYAYLEHKRSKNDKITGPVCLNVKKVMDHLTSKAIAMGEEIKVLRARLQERQEHAELLKNLAEKIAKPLSSVSEEGSQQQPRREDFSVIISAADDQMDIDNLKKEIKTVCKLDQNIPAPMDVVTTKAKQVILKMSNRKEADRVKEILLRNVDIKEKVKINTPRRRRNRILILSVDPSIDEDEVRKEVRRILDESVPDKLTKGLAQKLATTKLDPATKTVLEELYGETSLDFQIIKKITTKQNRVNWLIDVNTEGRDLLLSKKRICLDFERYRVVEFVSIIRCFKCQQFGHHAGICKSIQHCVRCAGNHSIDQCTSDSECCANCYFQDKDSDCAHRADSNVCPVFKEYRNKLLPSRL